MPQVTQWQEFGEWWVDIEPELLNAARRYGGAAGDPKDVVQDLAVLAVKNYRKFSERDEFRRWAFARLHWLLLDGIRSRKRGLGDSSDMILATEPSQENELFAREMLELVRTLPKRQLKVISRTIQGQSVEDIAKEMNIAQPTVRSLRRFGRNQLAMLLAKKDLRK
jgi:RNA polymerase sigma factor (sigma-70 family)